MLKIINFMNSYISKLLSGIGKEIIKNQIIIIFAILFLICSASCGSENPDSRLKEVRELSDSDPKKAMQKLSQINLTDLSEFNRHYYDLMEIRVRDKLDDIPQTDSLILHTIDYFKDKNKPEIYAEALYYGGRTYYSIGDLPQALTYFENAALILPEKSENDRLSSNIHFQIAFTLNALRMYKEAIPHLQISLDKDRYYGDTVYMIYTIQTIASNYLYDNQLDKAELNFLKARRLAEMCNDSVLTLKQDMYLSKIFNLRNNVDSALKLIQPVLHTIRSDSPKASRNIVLAYALECYEKAEKHDSVVLLAKELIHCKSQKNKTIGYEYLFKPESIKFLEKDSIIGYVRDMYNLVEEYLNRNNAEMAIVQNSVYNYRLHEQKRVEAEETRNKLFRFLIAAVGIAVILVIVILIMRNRNKGKKMELMQAYDVIADLHRKQNNIEIESDESYGALGMSTPVETSMLPIAKNIEQLREMIKREYSELEKNAKINRTISDSLLHSAGYMQAREMLKEGKPIVENSDIWEELGKAVEQSSPEFRIKLQTLLGGRLKQREYQLALLIKCGFTPTDLTTLMARSKGTISNQRSGLCRRLTGHEGSAQMADIIISLL